MTFSRIHHVTGAEERERWQGEGEKGVPGGHALSLYNIVSFEKFLPRKDPLPKPRRATLVSLKRLTLFPQKYTILLASREYRTREYQDTYLF